MSEITILLKAASAGDRQAADQAFALLYADLQRLAHSRMRRSGNITMLDTTALVHESWLRFQGAGEAAFADKQHFMGYAARVMHSVVVDFVRSRRAAAPRRRRGARDAQHRHRRLAGARTTTRSCASTRPCSSSPWPTAACTTWSNCATSAACRRPRSPRSWASPSARCSATGRRRGCFPVGGPAPTRRWSRALMSVGKETWGRLSPLLDELLDLPDAEREARLDALRAAGREAGRRRGRDAAAPARHRARRVHARVGAAQAHGPGRPDDRPVHAGARDRPRRHGHRVAGAPHRRPLRGRGGHQVPALGPVRPRRRGALRARGQHPRAPVAPAHRAPARRRRGGRRHPALPGAGVHRRRADRPVLPAPGAARGRAPGDWCWTCWPRWPRPTTGWCCTAT